MSQVEIYTSMMCGYCYRAKALLKKKNTSFKEIDVSFSLTGRQEMLSRSGGKTSVPQIFIDGHHVGGCDELYALEQKGKLDPMLQAKI